MNRSYGPVVSANTTPTTETVRLVFDPDRAERTVKVDYTTSPITLTLGPDASDLCVAVMVRTLAGEFR